MNRFNYREASITEIATHLKHITRQAYYKVLTYYKNKEDFEVVSKLKQAKIQQKINDLEYQKQNYSKQGNSHD